jgi:hypothetical protein
MMLSISAPSSVRAMRNTTDSAIMTSPYSWSSDVALAVGRHWQWLFGSAWARRKAADYGMKAAARAIAMGSRPKPIAPAL